MSLKWTFQERHDGEAASFRAAGYVAYVRDCDGDLTYWSVKFRGEVVREGEARAFEPYHFDIGIGEAEMALREHAGWRLSRLRVAAGERRSGGMAR